MTVGGSAFSGTMGSATIALIVFDGTAGRKVSATASGSMTSGTLQINSPTGTGLVSVGITSNGGFTDSTTLPVSGTYTILVVASVAGSLTLNLYDATDVQATITPGGSSVTVTTVPGQNEYLTFPGFFGQQIGINLTNGSYSSCNLTLYAPNGSTLKSGFCSGSTDTITPFTLTAYGTYKLSIDPQGSSSGSVIVQVTSVPPVTGTIAPGGPPVTVQTTQAGQDAVLTFSGTAGQKVSLTVTSVTNPSAYVYLVKPDGTNQTNIAISTGCGSTCFMDTQTLATTGTYTLWVAHNYTYTGSETLQLYNVPADATGTITIGGSAVSVATTVPGQNASLTFSATSGQKVSMSLSAGTYSSCNLTLYDPNGASVKTGSCSGSTGFVDTATLATTGTYKIFVDPQGAATGGVTVLLNNDADVTGTITIGGSAVTVTTTVVGQDGRLTFSGTAGQQVSLAVTSVTNPSAYVYLVKPDGTNQTNIAISSGCPCYMDKQTLATTGTYTLWIAHNYTYKGSETLQLYNVVDATGTVAVGGSSATLTINTVGQDGSVTFSGTSGQQVTVHITNNTIGNVTVSLKDPNNNTLTSTLSSSASFNLTSQTLSTTGTFTIFIDPYYPNNTGSISVNVTSP
jgi:hypothetical protein